MLINLLIDNTIEIAQFSQFRQWCQSGKMITRGSFFPTTRVTLFPYFQDSPRIALAMPDGGLAISRTVLE